MMPRDMSDKVSARKRLSREEERILDLQIDFMEGIVRRDPGYVDALQILGDDYTRRGQFAAGLRVDEQLAQLRPENPIVHYNLACSYSLTGNFNQAAAALDRAIALGYRDFKWLNRDPDLAEFRGHPLFKQLRAKIRRVQSRVE
jgi:tetratricopeptide (TPR) repeat protein